MNGRLIGVAASLVAAALGLALAFGGANHVGAKGTVAWDPAQFLGLACFALIASVVSAGASVRRLRSSEPPSVTHLVDVAALLVVSASAAFTISRAIGAERQNYWDAVHFAGIVWTGALAALGATVVSALASRRGDEPVRALGWLPGAVLFCWMLLWLVTWFGPLGDLLGRVAARWYLATHG